jgi:hypothetical protein
MHSEPKAILDLNYLKECFQLDSALPCGLRWNLDRPLSHFKNESVRKTWNKNYAGKPCGCIKDYSKLNKYYAVCINGKNFLNHRIIYAIYNGVTDFNGKKIDHIDGNSQNNNPQNLRLVTESENHLNSRIPKNNTTGYKNISFNKHHQKYECRVRTNSKNKYIGFFKILEEALHARNSYIEKAKLEIGDYFRI